jgi:DNA-binding NtrC family response regulator
MTLLAAHHWPGNVRELRNATERAVILAGHSAILPQRLPATEREILAQTLRFTRGNKSRAAEILGVSLKTIFNRLREIPSLNQFPKTGG